MPRKVMERECQVKFPLDPLWRLAQRQLSEEEILTQEKFAAMVGASRTMVRSALRRGVNCYVADKWAIALGHFPNAVWQNYYDDILEAAS